MDEQAVYRLLTKLVVGILTAAGAIAVLLALPHYIAHVDDVRAEAAEQRGSDR